MQDGLKAMRLSGWGPVDMYRERGPGAKGGCSGGAQAEGQRS